jgi:hypothetical protein
METDWTHFALWDKHELLGFCSGMLWCKKDAFGCQWQRVTLRWVILIIYLIGLLDWIVQEIRKVPLGVYVRIFPEIIRSKCSDLIKGLIHWLIQNLNRLLWSGGIAEGEAWTEEVGHGGHDLGVCPQGLCLSLDTSCYCSTLLSASWCELICYKFPATRDWNLWSHEQKKSFIVSFPFFFFPGETGVWT